MRKLLILALSVMLYTGAQAQLGSYYNGTAHYKSKGLSWGIKKPLGFTQKEADRPNIVQKWVKGDVSVMTMVKRLPTEMQGFDKSDWVQYLKYEGGVQDFGGELGPSTYTVLDNYPGVKTTTVQTMQRLDKKITIHMIQYMVIVDDVAFLLQIGAGSKASLDKQSRLIYQLANSVIFYKQYGN